MCIRDRKYIGFVFAKSCRQVTPHQAFELRNKLYADITPVGVFVDESFKDIISLVRNGTIEMIQLHGSEDEEYIKKLKVLTDKPIIKTVVLKNKGDAQKYTETIADYLLFDSKKGGSGKSLSLIHI